MKDFVEDKFIVIHTKHLAALNRCYDAEGKRDHPAVKNLKYVLDRVITFYESAFKKALNQKYLVCNQDEPYAPFVKALILDGFVTPEQYEEAAGKEYPAKAPVWYAETNQVWRLRPYGEALQDWMRRDLDSLPAQIVCAIGDRIPEDGSLPDCCEKQWFEGD
jgi:hypothetical protein